MNDQYGNSGVNTQSRDETLSNVYGGRDSAAPKGNIVGMNTNWSEGSLTPTPITARSEFQGFSATTASGGPVSDLATLGLNDIVTIGDQTMSAEVALHLGLLMRDEKSGMIRSPDASEAAANEVEQEQRQEQENAQDASSLDDQGEAIMSEAFEVAPGETLSAANDIMDGGEISAHNIEQLATLLGVEPGDVLARAEHVRAAYHHEAATVSARRVGVSVATATAALAHARENSLGALKLAAEQHINTGKPRYDHIVRDYVERLDIISPDFILSSMGNKAHWDASSQQIVVKTSRHGEMTWGAAVRAGLIKI